MRLMNNMLCYESIRAYLSALDAAVSRVEIIIIIEVTPITYWSGLGNRASVRVRFYGYV